jgi:hypothetical protein
VGRAESRLTAELRALYDAAGAPPLADIVRWGAARRPAVWFSVASLADWLRPRRMAVPSEQALLALVGFLSERARVSVRASWWRCVRRQAWLEIHPGMAARPGGP